MTIIHYFLGFPPMRSGGLTRYAIDLMKEQACMNHKVISLVPKMTIFPFCKTIKFKNLKSINDIDCFALKSPLPIPLLYGVKVPSDYMVQNPNWNRTIESFLERTKPDIIHIHTLMGLPLEFLEVAKDMGIKTVFTSHDYYGLCPKVNFINQEGILCPGMSENRCEVCNFRSWPRLLLWLRNTDIMVLLKKIKK